MSKVLEDNLYDTVLDKTEPQEFYTDTWSHLADEMKLLELRIHIQMQLQHEAPADTSAMNFKGLVLTEEEIYRLLNNPSPSNSNISEIQDMISHLKEVQALIQSKLIESAKRNILLPMKYLSNLFELSSFEEQCLLICLAPEMDRKYEKMYAFLQDDVTCKNPTVDLIFKLLCYSPESRLTARKYFSPRSKLNRFFLSHHIDIQRSFLTKELFLDQRLVSFLLDSGQLDERISHYCEVYYPTTALPSLLINQKIQENIQSFTDSIFNSHSVAPRSLLFYLWGNSGSGKKLQVKHFAHDFRKTALLVDIERMAREDKSFVDSLKQIVREAILQQSLLCFYNIHHLLGEDAVSQIRLKQLMEELDSFSGVVFLLSNQNWKPAEYLRKLVIIHIELSIAEDYERKLLWQHFGESYLLSEEVDWGALASKFRFTPGQIEQALITAKNLAGWHANEKLEINEKDIYESCYGQVQHKLEKKAVRINPKYSWNDIVLPQDQKDDLRNACNQIKYRHVVFGEWGFNRKLSYGKGLSVLFSGPPGTGKTMAAEVIAKELQLEIYKIDLSQVISKYIGETEKNLQEIFYEAKLCNCILFFDETDALFGKRSEVKDSHDKYANIETAYLLQKMEEYDGITILATNFLQNIDDAFMRRINFIIKFPFPDVEYREYIWRSMFPKEAPLHENIDYKFIANKFQIAGGNIKNIVVSSAFLAAEMAEPIGMKHILNAARHEIKKTGKLLLKEDMGEYSNLFSG